MISLLGLSSPLMIALVERRVLQETASADVSKFTLVTMLTLPLFVVEMKENSLAVWCHRNATFGLAFTFSFANSFWLSFPLLAFRCWACLRGHVMSWPLAVFQRQRRPLLFDRTKLTAKPLPIQYASFAYQSKPAHKIHVRIEAATSRRGVRFTAHHILSP